MLWSFPAGGQRQCATVAAAGAAAALRVASEHRQHGGQIGQRDMRGAHGHCYEAGHAAAATQLQHAPTRECDGLMMGMAGCCSARAMTTPAGLGRLGQPHGYTPGSYNQRPSCT